MGAEETTPHQVLPLGPKVTLCLILTTLIILEAATLQEYMEIPRAHTSLKQQVSIQITSISFLLRLANSQVTVDECKISCNLI